jgi:hypothetical protein
MSQKDVLGLPQYRLLDVRTLRRGSSFSWEIRESDGRLIESSSDVYSTDREAVRAANRAARAIKKQCSTPAAPNVGYQAVSGVPAALGCAPTATTQRPAKQDRARSPVIAQEVA